MSRQWVSQETSDVNAARSAAEKQAAAVCLEAGMSQVEVAEIVGVSQKSVSNFAKFGKITNPVEEEEDDWVVRARKHCEMWHQKDGEKDLVID